MTIPNQAGKAHSILVVDDDAASRQSAVETLQQLGYSVFQTGSAQEAVRLCEQHQGEILGARRIE